MNSAVASRILFSSIAFPANPAYCCLACSSLLHRMTRSASHQRVRRIASPILDFRFWILDWSIIGLLYLL